MGFAHVEPICNCCGKPADTDVYQLNFCRKCIKKKGLIQERDELRVELVFYSDLCAAANELCGCQSKAIQAALAEEKPDDIKRELLRVI